MGERDLHEFDHVVIGEAIVHADALLPSHDDAAQAQLCEVLRDGGLRLADSFGELTDGPFAALKREDQPNPGGVGQQGKDLDSHGNGGFGNLGAPLIIRIHTYIMTCAEIARNGGRSPGINRQFCYG